MSYHLCKRPCNVEHRLLWAWILTHWTSSHVRKYQEMVHACVSSNVLTLQFLDSFSSKIFRYPHRMQKVRCTYRRNSPGQLWRNYNLCFMCSHVIAVCSNVAQGVNFEHPLSLQWRMRKFWNMGPWNEHISETCSFIDKLNTQNKYFS